jgi:molybdopterin-guanine dinucleotide biosynthesis protein
MKPLHDRVTTKADQPGAEPLPSSPLERIAIPAEFPGIAATVSVCGAASNAGKTWLCEAIIRGLREDGRPTLALKVTRAHLGECPRGIETCGTCDRLKGDFEIVRDRSLLDVPRKDTGRYFEAGADLVLWLLARPAAIEAGILAALAEVPAGFVLVAEGNSFRDYASADVALMALSANGEMKASARHVLDRIDAFVRHYRLPGRGDAIGPKPLIEPADAWAFAQQRIASSKRSRAC